MCRLSEHDYYSVVFKVSLEDTATAVTLLDIRSDDDSMLVVTLDNCDGILTVDFGEGCGGSFDVNFESLQANQFYRFSLEVTPTSFSVYRDCGSLPIATHTTPNCNLSCSSLNKHNTTVSMVYDAVSSGCSGSSVGKVTIALVI